MSEDRNHELQTIPSFFGQVISRDNLISLNQLCNDVSSDRFNILVMGELTYGTGNLITGKRLKNIFSRLGYKTFMYNVKYINECSAGEEDRYLDKLKNLIINEQIHMIVGIHLWRSGRVINLLREKCKLKIPNVLIVSGTDANVFINVSIILIT
jgi:hypothetical protein